MLLLRSPNLRLILGLYPIIPAMVVSISLGALSLRAQAQAQGEKSFDQYWIETGLTVARLAPNFSNRECRESRESAEICLLGLDELAQTKEPGLRLLPAPIAKAYEKSGRIQKIVKDYGALVLVQSTPSPRINPETIDQKALFTQIASEYHDLKWGAVTVLTPKGIASINFGQIFEDLKTPSSLSPIDSVRAARVANAALRAVDAHASVVPLEVLKREATSAGSQKYAGIGVGIEKLGDSYVIKNPLDGSPADQAGIRHGDILTHINELPVERITMEDLIKLLRGQEGTRVQIAILRDRNQLKFTITRRVIVQENLSFKALRGPNNSAWGYVRLKSFMNHSGCKLMASAIEQLEQAKVQGLILDLRGNAGGSLEQAICIGGIFVGKRLIVESRPLEQGVASERIKSNRSQITRLPLVVLIDSQSASASELLAGALQDYKRAWILGERSFGKGTIQVSFPFDPEGKIVMFRTVARFHLPSGRTNQLVGISPDFEVAADPNTSANERFTPREMDFFPGALPATGASWTQSRLPEVRQLSECLSSSGQARQKMEELKAARRLYDFQALTAVDLLLCENAYQGPLASFPK